MRRLLALVFPFTVNNRNPLAAYVSRGETTGTRGRLPPPALPSPLPPPPGLFERNLRSMIMSNDIRSRFLLK